MLADTGSSYPSEEALDVKREMPMFVAANSSKARGRTNAQGEVPDSDPSNSEVITPVRNPLLSQHLGLQTDSREHDVGTCKPNESVKQKHDGAVSRKRKHQDQADSTDGGKGQKKKTSHAGLVTAFDQSFMVSKPKTTISKGKGGQPATLSSQTHAGLSEQQRQVPSNVGNKLNQFRYQSPEQSLKSATTTTPVLDPQPALSTGVSTTKTRSSNAVKEQPAPQHRPEDGEEPVQNHFDDAFGVDDFCLPEDEDALSDSDFMVEVQVEASSPGNSTTCILETPIETPLKPHQAQDVPGSQAKLIKTRLERPLPIPAHAQLSQLSDALNDADLIDVDTDFAEPLSTLADPSSLHSPDLPDELDDADLICYDQDPGHPFPEPANENSHLVVHLPKQDGGAQRGGHDDVGTVKADPFLPGINIQNFESSIISDDSEDRPSTADFNYLSSRPTSSSTTFERLSSPAKPRSPARPSLVSSTPITPTLPTFALPSFKTPLPPKTWSPDEPVIRPPFPAKVLDRNHILGMTSSIVLRTCFRVSEALDVGCNAAREGHNVLIELYASVESSYREVDGVHKTQKQFFTLADLWHTQSSPKIQAVWEGWHDVGLWDDDGAALLTIKQEHQDKCGDLDDAAEARGKLCRAVGKMIKLDHQWIFNIYSIWEAGWDDIDFVRGVVCA